MSFVIVIMMAIVRITTGMGRATVNGAECEFGADCPRQAGPEGADPETDARWRRPHSGSRIPGPGYGARGWEMVCQQFQETLGLGLYRVDGPRIPFPQRQPQRGFSPVQGARLGVRDRPRQCSSVGSAVRRSQPRDRVPLCQPGRSLPTFFPRGGVLRGQRGPQAILLPHQSFAYSSTKSCNCGQGSPWPLPGRRRTRFVQPS